MSRLYEAKFYYHVNKTPPPIPILSQMNPIHTPFHHASLRIIFRCYLHFSIGQEQLTVVYIYIYIYICRVFHHIVTTILNRIVTIIFDHTFTPMTSVPLLLFIPLPHLSPCWRHCPWWLRKEYRCNFSVLQRENFSDFIWSTLILSSHRCLDLPSSLLGFLHLLRIISVVCNPVRCFVSYALQNSDKSERTNEVYRTKHEFRASIRTAHAFSPTNFVVNVTP
jgi:hypothetical protein